MSTIRYSYFPKANLYCKEENELLIGTVYAIDKLTYEIGENVDPHTFFLALDVLGKVLFDKIVNTYMNAPNTPQTWTLMEQQLQNATARMSAL